MDRDSRIKNKKNNLLQSRKWLFSEIAINKGAIFIVAILCTAIIGFLLIASLFFTTEISSNTLEIAVYHRDNVVIHIVCIVGICIIIMKTVRMENLQSNKLRNISLLYTTVSGYILIIIANVIPGADQLNVLSCAYQMVNGDYSCLQTGGYLSYYPHQLGLAGYFSLYMLIAGDKSYMLIQFFNVIALVVTQYCLYSICDMIFKNERTKHLAMIMMPLFTPLLFYVVFVYGTIVGLMFSMAAIFFEYRFFQSRKPLDGILSAVFIALGVLLRNNYLIVLIAMVLFYFMDTVLEKSRLSILILCAAILLSWGSGKAIRLVYSFASGIEATGSVPATAFIAMGLQEGSKAPGWYNEYTIRLFKECGYDTELTSAEARKNITESLKAFASNPKNAVKFFYYKITSMWNDPTFQGFWIIEVRDNKLEGSNFGRSMKEGKLRHALTGLMNIYQSIVLFGVLMWFLLGYHSIERNQLILAVIFLGWFIFHLMWEAKAQYAVSAFVLLIPYAADGYIKINDCITAKR